MSMKPRIRIMIVDDHPVFRESLAHALAAEADLEVIDQCNDGLAAIASWEKFRPDVTLMDVSMHELDGVETVRRILASAPTARILMLTSSEEPQDASDALAAGAAGYIKKTSGYDDLLTAIHDVHSGGRSIDENIARCLATKDKGRSLSHRELEVLLLLRDGLSYQEIGRTLAMSERTARAHVAAIKEKLDAVTAAQCVARGFELGFLRRRLSRIETFPKKPKKPQ